MPEIPKSDVPRESILTGHMLPREAGQHKQKLCMLFGLIGIITTGVGYSVFENARSVKAADRAKEAAASFYARTQNTYSSQGGIHPYFSDFLEMPTGGETPRPLDPATCQSLRNGASVVRKRIHTALQVGDLLGPSFNEAELNASFAGEDLKQGLKDIAEMCR